MLSVIALMSYTNPESIEKTMIVLSILLVIDVIALFWNATNRAANLWGDDDYDDDDDEDDDPWEVWD